ncbi:MAG: hypothetical protein ACE5LG_05180 [Anaerolineae bacterium]
MRDTMRATVFKAPGPGIIKEVPYLVPGEVTIEIRACGLCGTDRSPVRSAGDTVI